MRGPVINGELTLPGADRQRKVLASLVPLSRAEPAAGAGAQGGACGAGAMQYIGDNGRFLEKAFEQVMPLVELLAEEAVAHGADRSKIEAMRSKAKLNVLRNRVPIASGQLTEGVEAVTRIIRSLKTFAHPGDDFQPVDVARALESTVTVATNEWKYVADLRLDAAPDLPPVRAAPGMLNQVLLNLVVNAAQAVEERRAAEGTEQLGSITVAASEVDGSVEIRVSDDGCGIPDEVRSRIYDQFFTTKPIGKGSGQGLSICRNIIQAHGGAIDFTTSGAGTTFTVLLPAFTGDDDHPD
jgi:signal transduction histidine kinase